MSKFLIALLALDIGVSLSKLFIISWLRKNRLKKISYRQTFSFRSTISNVQNARQIILN